MFSSPAAWPKSHIGQHSMGIRSEMAQSQGGEDDAAAECRCKEMIMQNPSFKSPGRKGVPVSQRFPPVSSKTSYISKNLGDVR